MVGLEEEGDDMGELWEEAMSLLTKWATKRKAASTRVGPAAPEEEEEVAVAPHAGVDSHARVPNSLMSFPRCPARRCRPQMRCTERGAVLL